MSHNDRLKRRLEGLSTPPIPMRRSMRTPKMAAGDQVRVHETAEAIAAGVAGLVGKVVAVAVPPVAEVAVIGATAGDSAVNVTFEGREGTFWFSKEQLDLVARASGSGGKQPGSNPQVLTPASGEAAEPAPPSAKSKPWWKFGRG